MNREELLVYIRNAVLIGDMVNNCQDFDVITNLECRIKEYVDLVELKESINGSIEYNGMYFKEENGEIILTLCLGNYSELNLGDSVDAIGHCAFLHNTAIKKVTGKCVSRIGKCAFAECGIKGVDFPILTEIGEGCFYGSFIESVKLPLLDKISSGAFKECHHFTVVLFSKII